MNKQDCILFSGGAKGSEAAFGAIAEEHEIEEVNFSFQGHTIERQRGLRVLNHEELLRGDVSLEYVSRLMNRRYTETPTLRKLLQSIWYQVNSGQEIYVIGEILEDGQFEIVSATDGVVVGDAWSDFIPESAKLTADWTYPWVCGNCEKPRF